MFLFAFVLEFSREYETRGAALLLIQGKRKLTFSFLSCRISLHVRNLQMRNFFPTHNENTAGYDEKEMRRKGKNTNQTNRFHQQ